MGFSFFDTKKPAQFYVQNSLISAYGRKLDSILEQQVLLVLRIWNNSPGPGNQLAATGTSVLAHYEICREIIWGPFRPLNLLFLSNCISK
jgi:hypothetical protein